MKKKIQKRMKEFDIEKAKAGAPVCTRDGRPVRIICWDFKEYGRKELDEQFPIIALVKYDEGERAFTYRESGKCRVNKDDELVMAPVKHEGWVNLYMPDDGFEVVGELVGRSVFESEENAKKVAIGNDAYIATAKIEWEE